MNLTLYRDKPGKVSMRGRVEIPGAVLQTLEDIPGGSDEGEPVPAGEYRLVLHDSAKYGKVWAMVNPALGIYYQPGDRPNGVGRFACLFAHWGNRDHDTLGCILVGLGRGANETIVNSRAAVALLKERLPWVEHTLTIVNG